MLPGRLVDASVRGKRLRPVEGADHANKQPHPLEVLIVEGDAGQVTELADRLRTVKGVLFAETVVARPDLR